MDILFPLNDLDYCKTASAVVSTRGSGCQIGTCDHSEILTLLDMCSRTGTFVETT